MTEQADVRELRNELTNSGPRDGEIRDLLDRASAALERLEALEGFLDREGIRRGPIDHGLPTPTLVDRVEAYGHECAARAVRATTAPAPQQGGEE